MYAVKHCEEDNDQIDFEGIFLEKGDAVSAATSICTLLWL